MIPNARMIIQHKLSLCMPIALGTVLNKTKL